MKITQYNYYSAPAFNAKFLYSDDLQKIVDYTIEETRNFPKLDAARKNIETSMLNTRLLLELTDFKGKPAVIISRYNPRKNVVIPKDFERDYALKKKVRFISSKEMDPREFAYKLILKIGANVPNGEMFRKAILIAPGKRKFSYIV